MRLRLFYIVSLALTGVVFVTRCEGHSQPPANHSSVISFSLSEGTSSADDRDDDSSVVGQVVAINAANKQFTLRTGGSGQVLIFTTDSTTKFDDFDKAGLANAFSSIAVGQLLEVEMVLPNRGLLRAKEVELVSTKKKEK